MNHFLFEDFKPVVLLMETKIQMDLKGADYNQVSYGILRGIVVKPFILRKQK